MHGEFLAGLISSDKNFYRPRKYEPEKNNKYAYTDPLEGININIKQVLNRFNYPDFYINQNGRYGVNALYSKLVSDIDREKIDLMFDQKHLCLATHIFNRDPSIFNLPRLVSTRLICDREYMFLVYLLGVVKSWLLKREIENTTMDFLDAISKTDPLVKKHAEIIKEQKTYSWIERLALTRQSEYRHNFYLKKFLHHYYYDVYLKECVNLYENKNKFLGWNYLDVRNLMENPNNNLSLLKETFDLHDCLDANAIENYHLKNINLIKEIFGMDYQTLLKHPNRFDILQEYIISIIGKNFFIL